MMKNTKVILAPLTMDAREQFILDNQWAFKYGYKNDQVTDKVDTTKRYSIPG